MEQKFRALVKGEMSTLRYMQAGVPQGSVLSPTLYNFYINDILQTHGVHLALSADDYVLRKLQCALNSTAAWCERWNIKNQLRQD
jgi:hypothetical protein